MASFPRVVGKYGELLDGANSTTHAVPHVTVTGGILANDIEVIVGAFDGSASMSNWNGYTQGLVQVDGTSTVTLFIGWRRMSGGETGTVTLTTSASERGAWHSFLVRGASTSVAPVFSSGATGNSTNPNPASVTLQSGEDTLVCAVAALDNSAGISPTAPPSGYAGFETAFSTSGGAIGYAFLKVTGGTSEDPGTFTAGSEQWCTGTIAFRPAGVETDGSRAVRSFNGTSHSIHFPASGALASPGAISIAMLTKRGANSWSSLMVAHNSGGTTAWGLLTNNLDLLWFNFVANGTFNTSTGWAIVAVTKADGPATPRFHVYSFATGNWTHTNAGGSAADLTSVAGGTYRLAESDGVPDYNGRTALAGVWSGANLTDAQVEELTWGADGLGTGSWTNHPVAPTEVWELNQAVNTDQVEGLMGVSDSSVINGTAIDTADVPPLWRFNPAAGPVIEAPTPGGATAGGFPPTQYPFLIDTATDSGGTVLQTHNPEVGDWAIHPSSSGGGTATLEITAAGRIANSASNVIAIAYNNAPTPAEYDLVFDAVFLTQPSTEFSGFTVHQDPAADTMYIVRYDLGNTRWDLIKRVAGSQTFLDDWAFTSVWGGETQEVTVQVRAGGINVLFDGAQQLTTTDTAITGGYVGIRGLAQGGSPTAGLQFDNVMATSPATSVTQTPTPGGATAGGVSPKPRTTSPVGGATAGGSTPAPRAHVPSGASTAGGNDVAAAVTATTTIGGAAAGGVAPHPKISVPAGAATAGGSDATSVATATPSPGAAIAGGTSPRPTTALTPGAAVAGGAEPATETTATPAPGGAAAGGNAPQPRAAAVAGEAVAGGRSPAPVVPVPAGVAIAAGTTAAAVVPVAAGGATAGGVAPTDGAAVVETPAPGGATAGGNPPSPRAAASTAGATAGGNAPASIAPVSPGGASAEGTAPSAIAAGAVGGATAAGQAPHPHAPLAPAAADGAGTPPHAVVPVAPGGAVAGGNVPADSAAIVETPTPGGATAAGRAPTARTVTSSGGAAAAGSSPAARVLFLAGGATAGGTAPATIVIATPQPGAAQAGGLPPDVLAVCIAGAAVALGNPPHIRVKLPPGAAAAGGNPPAQIGASPDFVAVQARAFDHPQLHATTTHLPQVVVIALHQPQTSGVSADNASVRVHGTDSPQVTVTASDTP